MKHRQRGFILNPYRFNSTVSLDSNTIFLAHFDGPDRSTSFVDMAGNAISIGNGLAELDNAEKAFGHSSLLLTSSGYLNSNDPSLNLSGSDYTIECWAKTAGVGSGFGQALFSTWGTMADGRITVFQLSSGTLSAFEQDGGGANSVSIAGATAFPLDVFNHVALCRSGSTLELFLNGVSEGTATAGAKTTLTDYFRIGVFDTGGGAFFGAFSGWIDEVRISNIARYSSNFTPTGPLI